MVPIFVLVTFLVLMSIDYLLNRDKYHRNLAPVSRNNAEAGGVNLPPALGYHPGHSWARNEGNAHVRIGVDAFAASLLGHITHIELPKRGRWIQQGDRGWTIDTDKGPVTMLASAGGEVIAINEEALRHPELVENDPYNKGWLIELRDPEVDMNFRNLLSGNVAKRWMEESVGAVRETVKPAVKLCESDGHLVAHLGTQLQNQAWTQLTSTLFRN